MENRDELNALERELGFEFADKALLQRAFVHRSFLNENPELKLESNERLEFLGDAVLGFVVAEHLYHLFPSLPEGALTSLRAALVRTETLARVAERLRLGSYLYLGKGEEAGGGRARPVLLASTFEALVGVLLIDRGLDVARTFVLSVLQDELARVVREKSGKDDKSRLQELAQARWQITPTYRTVGAEGPDHDRTFTVDVMLGDRAVGRGVGRSKRIAEQNAASEALARLAQSDSIPD